NTPPNLPTFFPQPAFGYPPMGLAPWAIGALAFLVWGHHMFTVGFGVGPELFFMYATMLVAVPTGVKLFNWLGTMWGGSLTFEAPMLFALGFILVFLVGGV